MLEPLEEREMVTRKRFGAPWMKRTLAISALLLVAATPDDSPVADAAQRGEAGEIRNLLRQGADPSAAQPDGMTALHWSSLNNQPDIVETLIFAGATLQPTTRVGGYTPLHLASRSGHAGVVVALLEAGANPDLLTGTGAASLHFAAEANAAGVVKALAGHGADVNIRDGYSSRTPAMFAAARNSAGALQALIDAGADLDLVSNTRDIARIAEADQEERTRRARIREAEKEPDPDAEPGAQRPGQGRGGPPGAGGQGAEPELPKTGPKVLSGNEQIGNSGRVLAPALRRPQRTRGGHPGAGGRRRRHQSPKRR